MMMSFGLGRKFKNRDIDAYIGVQDKLRGARSPRTD
jgi:hypothetical protein